MNTGTFFTGRDRSVWNSHALAPPADVRSTAQRPGDLRRCVKFQTARPALAGEKNVGGRARPAGQNARRSIMTLEQYYTEAWRAIEAIDTSLNALHRVTDSATADWIVNGRFSTIQHKARLLEIAMAKSLTAAADLLAAVSDKNQP